MEALDKKMDLMMDKIENLTIAVDFLSKKYDEFKINLKRSIEYQEILNKSMQKLQKENKEQKLELVDVKLRLETLERKGLESSLNLFPIINTDQQDLYEVISKIGGKIGMDLNRETISDVFRRPKRKNGNPGEVVVKCVSVKIRDDIISKIKMKKLMHADIGINCNMGRIFCNEELTKEAKNIYYAALKEKKEKNWKYLWVKGGRSYVKKEEGGVTFRLDNMGELEKIK